MRAGLNTTGGIGIWFEFVLCLVSIIPVLPTGVQVSTATTTRLIAVALIFPRLGLWVFDLSVNQMLQERVDNAALGEVSALNVRFQAWTNVVSVSRRSCLGLVCSH